MNIICISPKYLNALKRESQEYSFGFQGYGKLKSASQGLMKTNASDIYGFCYVSDELPEKVGGLSKFMELCDMISEGSKAVKRFVFCLKDDSRLSEMVSGANINNMEVYLTRFSDMTDVVIRRDIFGTILESYLNPFTSKNFEAVQKPPTLKGIKYVPVFPPRMIKALEPFKPRDSMEQSIIEDDFLSSNRNNQDFFFLIRTYGIAKHYGKEAEYEVKIQELLNNIKDYSLRVSYELVFSYVKLRGI